MSDKPKSPIDRLVEKSELSVNEMGTLADLFWQVKNQRLAADKEAKALKSQEDAAEAKLIEQMLRQKVTATGGKDVILTLPSPKEEPVVQDWQEFWKFIKSQDDMSLFERRPGRAAIKERWLNGEDIPGVSKFPVYKLSKQGVK